MNQTSTSKDNSKLFLVNLGRGFLVPMTKAQYDEYLKNRELFQD